MMTFSVVGTRIAFALPLDLRANWVFRITPPHDGARLPRCPPPRDDRRRRAADLDGVSRGGLLSSWPWAARPGEI